MSNTSETVTDTTETTCCVVGGGPAGLVLAYLLARKGVPVTLLEAHPDFDRDFRGDTIHPSTLEALDRLGLADKLHTLSHGKFRVVRIVSAGQTRTLASFAGLRIKYPYIMTMPQVKFLDFLAAEVNQFPHARVVTGATVQRLVENNGAVAGVRYRDTQNQWHEVRAKLVVAADGRHSKVRALCGLEPHKTSPPMDVLWFRLPKGPGEAGGEAFTFHIEEGQFVIRMEREADWQLGYVFLKGGFPHIKAEGIETFRDRVAKLIPALRGRLDEHLGDWKHMAVLSVESSRLPVWHRPGLLFLGDAAHTMSPVGGVGINYAIQDAIAAANLLAGPLESGRVTDADLAAVQRRREWPVKVIQTFQTFLQNQIVRQAFEAGPFRLPLPARVLSGTPGLRWVLPTMLGWGVRPERPR